MLMPLDTAFLCEWLQLLKGCADWSSYYKPCISKCCIYIHNAYIMQNQIIEYMGILLSLKKKSTKQCTAELVGKVKHEDIQKNQIGLIKYNCTL